MKKIVTLLALSVSALSALSAANYIQVKELMETKKFKTKVSFSDLSPFLNEYVVGTTITIEEKEGQLTGVALTTKFEGFVEMAEEKMSPLISGDQIKFIIPEDGSWTTVEMPADQSYNIRLIQEGHSYSAPGKPDDFIVNEDRSIQEKIVYETLKEDLISKASYLDGDGRVTKIIHYSTSGLGTKAIRIDEYDDDAKLARVVILYDGFNVHLGADGSFIGKHKSNTRTIKSKQPAS